MKVKVWRVMEGPFGCCLYPPWGYARTLTPSRTGEVRLTRVFSVGCRVCCGAPADSGALPLTGQRAEDIRRQPGAEPSAVTALAAQLEVAGRRRRHGRRGRA